MPMRKAFLQAALLFVLITLPFALLIYRWSDSDPVSGEDGASAPVTKLSEHHAPNGARAGISTAAGPHSPEAPDPAFEAWERFLTDADARTTAVERLASWRAKLEALPRDQSVERLLAYLESGHDAVLHAGFHPGPGGELVAAPTLRTAAIDLLGRIDPFRAHALAAAALEGPKSSADEFALHLRNFAWGAPADITDEALRDFLAERTLSMIRYPPWQENPDGGYQEAFDVLVWARAVEAVPLMVRLMGADNVEALAHPAGLTLDRLVLLEPTATLSSLLETGGTAFPLADAGYFARADPDDPTQRALLQTWFLHPDRSAAQRDQLLQLIPNFNLRHSFHLLSEQHTFSETGIRQRLHATRSLMEDWLNAPEFSPWHADIRSTAARLDILAAHP